MTSPESVIQCTIIGLKHHDNVHAGRRATRAADATIRLVKKRTRAKEVNMVSQSHFRQLAHLITVGDICSPFIATFDAQRLVAEVFEEWGVELCGERLDPMDQIALVEGNQKIRGWVGFDMLDSGKTISDCMERIAPDTIMTADTTLMEAAAAFSKTQHPFFFVLRGNHFVGWVSYRDLHKPPLRLCLFALLINIERMLLDAVSLSPGESLAWLSKGRLNKAKKIYARRNYRDNREGKPFDSLLLECTTMADKLAIAGKVTSIKDSVPSLTQRKFRGAVERLRNEIAHPGSEERSSSLLTREKLWPFIEWAERTQSELENFLNQAKMGGVF